MRTPDYVEVLLGVSGLFFLIISFIMQKPLTFDRVMQLEALFLKYFLLLVGIMLIVLTFQSLRQGMPFLQRPKSKALLLNLILLGMAIFSSILILEIFLEFTAIPGCKQGDPIYDHSYIPNCVSRFTTAEWNTAVTINSAGLRDDEITPKTEHEFRILMLGDSFTWGYGVEQEQTFSELLQQQLQLQGINVINAGATSYSPILEYLFLKNKGLQFQPDMVILNFDLSDLQDDYLREKKAQFQEEELIAVYNPEKDGFGYNLRKRIQITNLINSIFVWIDKTLPPPTEIDARLISDIRYDRYGLTREQALEQEEEHWERTFSYITKIAELCEENNITFVLSTYPYGHQISNQEWVTGRHNAGLLREEKYSDRAEKKIEQYAKEQHILLISMFTGFRLAEQQRAPLYFSYDGHFNQEGHAVAAEILYAGLTQEKLLPSSEITDGQRQKFIYPLRLPQTYGK